MDTKFWSKSTLYKNVDNLFKKINIEISATSFPISSTDIAYTHCEKLIIKELDLDSMCAIIHKQKNRTSIALNSNRDKAMQNFDCMHELIHYFFHDLPDRPFFCSDSSDVVQNSFQEWQANEGAAQALVPYQIFIPMYVGLSNKYAKDTWQHAGINSELAQFFNVSSKVIQNRINNLGYEIYQYMNDIPLKNIVLLSKNQLNKRGVGDDCRPQKDHCTNCLSIINTDNNFCHICGTDLKVKSDLLNFKTNKGVGYMKYNGILIDQNYKAVQCPRCKNEEIHPEGNFCKICGINLFNKCNGYWENNDFLNGCNATLDGSSRYCPFCGKESYFYRERLLKSWYESEDDEDPIPPF